MAANIIVCTLLMWVLTAIVVIPLTNRLFVNALSTRREFTLLGGPIKITNDLIEKYQGLYVKKYIEAGVIVSAIAGFLAGLAGFTLIGFAWKAKAWPGLLALIGASFIGSHLTGSPTRF
jgi:hypothetical protein